MASSSCSVPGAAQLRPLPSSPAAWPLHQEPRPHLSACAHPPLQVPLPWSRPMHVDSQFTSFPYAHVLPRVCLGSSWLTAIRLSLL